MGGMRKRQFALRTAFYVMSAVCITAALVRGAFFSQEPYCDICRLSLPGMIIVLVHAGRHIHAAHRLPAEREP